MSSIMLMIGSILFSYSLYYVNDPEIEDENHGPKHYQLYCKKLNFIMASLIIYGFFSIRRFTLSYKHAIKLTPHFGEAISIGLINMLANFLGAI